MSITSNSQLQPGLKFELIKLWPHARSQGKERGQIWEIGNYSPQDGIEVIWLVNEKGEYLWTVDVDFIKKHFKAL